MECGLCNEQAKWSSVYHDGKKFVARYSCDEHKDDFPEDEHGWTNWLRFRIRGKR